MTAKIGILETQLVDKSTNKVDKIVIYPLFTWFTIYFMLICPPKHPLPYKNLDYYHNGG
jgi:hypothetical protein